MGETQVAVADRIFCIYTWAWSHLVSIIIEYLLYAQYWSKALKILTLKALKISKIKSLVLRILYSNGRD